MSMTPKWKTFSREELYELARTCFNKRDFFEKMGYQKYCSTTMKNILKKYPDLPLESRRNTTKCLWKNFSKEEIIDKAQGCTSQSEFMKKLGYTTSRPEVYKEIIEKYPEVNNLVHTHYDSLWKQYTYEQLLDFAQNSSSQTEFCQKIGYKERTTGMMEIIHRAYPDLIIPKEDNRCKWKLFSQEELQKIANESEGLTDFYTKIGYSGSGSKGQGKGKGKIKQDILKAYPDFIFPERASISCGELKIKRILEDNNIPFQTQIKIENLYGDKQLLSFDFGIYDEDKELICYIEYQGEQHFYPVDFFGGNKKFQKQTKYDKLKREYCLKNNIKLVEIPYVDYSKIDYNYLKERIYEYNN